MHISVVFLLSDFSTGVVCTLQKETNAEGLPKYQGGSGTGTEVDLKDQELLQNKPMIIRYNISDWPYKKGTCNRYISILSMRIYISKYKTLYLLV